MVADFLAPVAPSGWLELDGSTISTSTYSALYGAMSITTSGTRSNGSPTVTSIPDTTNLRAGYYVFGTGIASGTTILSVDSSTQITLSGNASSSGSSSFAVSPWLLNTGTIQLPDLTTAGRFRRSRSSSTKVGDVQASDNVTHTHAVVGTSGVEGQSHTHSFSGNTAGQSNTHAHNGVVTGSNTYNSPGGATNVVQQLGFGTSDVATQDHTHFFSGTTGNPSANHTHAINITSASSGGSETRPVSIVLLTCVKT